MYTTNSKTEQSLWITLLTTPSLLLGYPWLLQQDLLISQMQHRILQWGLTCQGLCFRTKARICSGEPLMSHIVTWWLSLASVVQSSFLFIGCMSLPLIFWRGTSLQPSLFSVCGWTAPLVWVYQWRTASGNYSSLHISGGFFVKEKDGSPSMYWLSGAQSNNTALDLIFTKLDLQSPYWCASGWAMSGRQFS